MNKFKKLLSRITFTKAKKLLGAYGDKLLMEGGRYTIDIEQDVVFTDNKMSVNTPEINVQLIYDEASKGKLRIESSTGRIECAEVGAVLSLILEEKMALGLAEPPKERVPIESLSPDELVKLALKERQERADKENIKVESFDKETPWCDYAVTNHSSGKTYRVAFRGFEKGVSYCSCPDFKINTLGTCKHLICLEKYVKKKFSKKALSVPYERERSSVSVNYLNHEFPVLRFMPEKGFSNSLAKNTMEKYLDCSIDSNFTDFAADIASVSEEESEIHIHPDAQELLNRKLFAERMERVMQQIRANPDEHPLRTSLLNAELRPYQLDGIAFAVGTGRAILADDMGLGKTIQGVGVAELFAREAGIEKVLIVCPASLKTQWREEIIRFSGRSVQLILGSAEERSRQYQNDAFFTICNYEQVLRDSMSIEEVAWDLIILDEGQRIKNWESLTSRTIKTLNSTFALVLSGTPLENRLEELYNIVTFIDHHRLGPAFRFMNTHREVDDRGKVLGYKNLDKLRKNLEPIMLRRTRKMVLKELPERTNHVVRITPTEEQAVIDTGQKKIISQIIHKPFISEMDLLRLQKALLIARMAADSTFLVNKEIPHHSSKLEELAVLLERLLRDEDRKIIIFSEWTTMLNLIEEEAIADNIKYVRLDGSVPQKKRGGLVKSFQTDPECRLFLTTNAGSTGLNLQAANTVINIDLPWNPAILEQRIGRAHRMGQERQVDVYLLISEGMLEEKIMGLLGAKLELANAAIDQNSDLVQVSMQSGIEELKRRMEILIGGPDDIEIDNSMRNKVQEEISLSKEQRISDAGGKLLTAAFEFLGAAVDKASKETHDPVADSIFNEFAETAKKGEDGKFNLNISLDESALKNLAGTLSSILKQQNRET